MSIVRRLLNRWRERSLAREFDEEIRFHLDQRAARNRRAGLNPDVAAVEARRHFGNIPLAREGMREARVAGWLDDLARDLRHGGRVLLRRPILTILAAVALSLGIGANAAIFSLLNAALLRPLPYPDADRLVSLRDGDRSGRGMTSPTIPELLDLRARTTTLDGVSFIDTRDFQIEGGSEPVRTVGARVEALFFHLLGARPALGRLLFGSDSDTGSAPVVVLSDGFWRRNFSADTAIVGRTLVVNGTAHVIVGVLPAGFGFNYLYAEAIDLYLPYPMIAAYTSRSGEFANVRRVFAIGRLKPGSSLPAATADLAAVAATIAAEHPELYRQDAGGPSGFFIDAEPLRASLSGRNRSVLLMLFGAVVLVLLIACVNAGQFLLAQAIEREPEVALRSALGASRTRLVRQFLAEVVLLTFAGAALGVLQAIWLVKWLRTLLPPSAGLVGDIGVDASVLLFTASVAVVTTTVCGLLPALRFADVHPRRSLDTRGASGGRSRSRAILLALEVALSLVLLVQAGLLLWSLQLLQRAQTGFSSDAVTVMRVRGMGDGNLGETYRRFVDQITAIPGLESVALTSAVLPGRPGTPFTIPGRSENAASRARQTTSYQIVSPGYFSVLRIPLLDGRTFSNTDIASALPVAIVNEKMAQEYWPGQSPIGQQVRSGAGPREATLTVVGVVGNVRPMLQADDVPQIYVSYLQQGEPNMAVMIRSDARTATPIDAVKRAIWSVEPRQAVFNIRALDEMLSQSLASQRVVASLIGSFAVLALVMSTTGVFTLVSYVTSRRVKEIALRRAIGARDSDVFWLLAGQTFVWTLIGLATGIAGSAMASRALRAAVVGVTQLDTTMVVVIAGVYLAVVALAMALPALKALRIDPIVALRQD